MLALPIVGDLLKSGLSLVANALLSKGKDFIKDKTGVDLDKAKLSNEDYVKLQQFQMEHEEELLRLQIEDNRLNLEEFKIQTQDISSARLREVEINKDPNSTMLSKVAAPILAFGTVALTFGLFYILLFMDSLIDGGKKDIVIYILGALTSITSQIFQYYFGSSRSSQSKDDTISKIIKDKK